jgi:hypothetical protein
MFYYVSQSILLKLQMLRINLKRLQSDSILFCRVLLLFAFTSSRRIMLKSKLFGLESGIVEQINSVFIELY